MRKNLLKIAAAALIAGASLTGAATAANAAGAESHPPVREWSWTGFFGHFDRASAQRGLQVYTEVCSACHSLDRVAYRNLTELGYSMDEIKEFAAQKDVQDGPNDQGEMYTRPARPSDHFVAPYPNEQASRAANGGAYPPDLSLIIKNRNHGSGSIPVNFFEAVTGRGTASGADYVYALLTGFKDAPTGFKLADGKYYNEWFAGHQISMPPPLYPDGVTFADGTKATVEQQAHDVATFLAWAAEPELEARKAMGLKVMLFLVVFLGIVIAVKRRIWANVH